METLIKTQQEETKDTSKEDTDLSTCKFIKSTNKLSIAIEEHTYMYGIVPISRKEVTVSEYKFIETLISFLYYILITYEIEISTAESLLKLLELIMLREINNETLLKVIAEGIKLYKELFLVIDI